MRTRLFSLGVLLLALVVGCGAQPGKTTITYPRGKSAPPPITARQSGLYTLYASNSGNALYSMELQKGDQYGFRKSGEQIVAFARDQEVPLENWLATSYFWKFQKDEKD